MGSLKIPTYSFRCPTCGRVEDSFATIAQYTAPDYAPPACHEAPMERFYTAPQNPLLDALVNDRHYQDLRTLDGVDVSSREKHQRYMKERGLTTADDYTNEWQRAAQQRAREMAGEDPSRISDIRRAWDKLNGNR